jgi:hypothetical protein
LADGTLVREADTRFRRRLAVERARPALPALLVFASVLASRCLRRLSSAVDRSPDEHWSFLKRDVSAMRMLSDQGTKRSWLNPHPFDFDHLAHVDYGGEDGHIMQDFRDASTTAELHGTRCTSTRYALTRYFCGAEVADNLNSDARQQRATTADDALELGFDWSTLVMGGGGESVAQFIAWLDAARATAGRGEAHKRLVYRLGIGQSKPSDPSLSHVWSIITQVRVRAHAAADPPPCDACELLTTREPVTSRRALPRRSLTARTCGCKATFKSTRSSSGWLTRTVVGSAT